MSNCKIKVRGTISCAHKMVMILVDSLTGVALTGAANNVAMLLRLHVAAVVGGYSPCGIHAQLPMPRLPKDKAAVVGLNPLFKGFSFFTFH